MTVGNRLNTACRVCKSSNLTELFSLGEQYISNFVDKDKIKRGQPKCEIALQLCNNCTLTQQKWTAPQDFLYTRHYWYKSGTTHTMRLALHEIVTSAVSRVQLVPEDVVLDIGANDGTLLSYYQPQWGCVRVAVEPAKNMKDECHQNCEFLISDFWSEQVYVERFGIHTEGLPTYKAKIITAIGMFYDMEDPNQFVADVKKVLHSEGIFVCQLMCAKQMLENMDVGNLSHEHLEFYTLASLQCLFEQNGLEIEDIEENKVNGGSYRLYVRHADNTKKTVRLGEEVIKELQTKVYLAETWRNWFKKLESYKSKLRAFIVGEVDNGKTVYVYGASTKGNVILQWLGCNNEDIPYAADKSEEKWGKYTVGTGIKIISEDEMRKAKPDYLFVLPYAFINEFIERERELLQQGTKLIVPLPTPRIIPGSGGVEQL